MDTRTLRLLEYDKVRDMVRAHASSPLGKELVDRMRPARDPRVVASRLQETTDARDMIAEFGTPPLGGLRDVREVVQRAEKHGALTARELQDVADSAACCRRMRRYVSQARERYASLHAQAHLLGEFVAVERAVDGAIGPNSEVLDTASPELASARRRMRALNEEVQRELQRIVSSASMADKLQDPIITQRNGRFCLPVRAEARNSFKGIVHDLSASGQTAFMEPLTVVELGNDLREAERREEEEVNRVLAALSEQVGRVAGHLLSSLDTAARLDLIYARALCARTMDATAPELNADGVIDIIHARHPLLGDKAVPIDIGLGDGDSSTLLITGPNTGGKTVTLKTVGLLTVMAQSGLHVPAAAGTRLAMFDAIFADIGDEQSIEQNLSTFSGHMTNIVRIVKEAGPRSLILLDEVGAGTDPAEGAALAKAILLEFHQRGARTIATTHYGELKAFAQTTEGFVNASVEFDLETLRPTYRVIRGLPGSSNALSISQRLGLPKTLIGQAKALMGEETQAMEQVLKQAEGVRRALDRERTATARARREAEETAAKLRSELQQVEDKREKSLGRAREQAQEVLEKARREANKLLDELRAAVREQRQQNPHLKAPDVASLRGRTREVLGVIGERVGELPKAPTPERPAEKPALTRVEAGQQVVVRSVGHRGIALTAGCGDEQVEVQVGIMRIRVAVSDLEAASGVQRTPPPLPEALRTRQIEPEIHLLGLRADEAEERLEEYLYHAFEDGLTKVRIVHGFGTGALRSMVQNLLRHHPVVRHFRSGEAGEGGGGVTIADVGRGA